MDKGERFKRDFIIALVSLAILAIPVYANILNSKDPVTAYTFPATAETVEEMLRERQLNWTVDGEMSRNDGHVVISLNNDNKTFIILNMILLENGAKSMNMSIYSALSGYEDPIQWMNTFNSEYLPGFVDMTGNLYGRPGEVKLLFTQVMSDMKQLDDFSNAKIWKNRIGDNHYIISLQVSDTYNNSHFTWLISAMNTMSKEYSAAAKIATAYSTMNYTSMITEAASVHDVTETAKLECSFEKPRTVIVKGYMDNIREKDGMIYADLIDDTGDVTVRLPLTNTMNANELREERIHYIRLDGSHPEGLAEASALSDIPVEHDILPRPDSE